MTGARPSLVLMGLRGSGKSTVGRLVGARAGLPFVDLDDVTVALLGGGSIPDLWARLGEASFRAGEVSALGAELGSPGGSRVLALGGGTPTAPGAADLLRAATAAGSIVLVYLRAQPGTLRSRLEAGGIGDRPSLTGAGALAEIETVFRARDALYLRIASHTLETDGREAEEIAADLVSLMA